MTQGLSLSSQSLTAVFLVFRSCYKSWNIYLIHFRMLQQIIPWIALMLQDIYIYLYTYKITPQKRLCLLKGWLAKEVPVSSEITSVIVEPCGVKGLLPKIAGVSTLLVFNRKMYAEKIKKCFFLWLISALQSQNSSKVKVTVKANQYLTLHFTLITLHSILGLTWV